MRGKTRMGLIVSIVIGIALGYLLKNFRLGLMGALLIGLLFVGALNSSKEE
jgi:Na+/serine symporter